MQAQRNNWQTRGDHIPPPVVLSLPGRTAGYLPCLDTLDTGQILGEMFPYYTVKCPAYVPSPPHIYV